MRAGKREKRNRITGLHWKGKKIKMSVRIIITGAVASVLLYFILRSLPLSEHQKIVCTLKATRIPVFLGGILFYCAAYLGRTARFYLLLDDVNVPFFGLLCVVAVHNFYNMILPFRTGELSFLYFCRKHLKVEVLSSSTALITARLSDLILIVFTLIVLLTCCTFRNTENDYSGIILASAGVFIALVVTMYFIRDIVNFFIKTFLRVVRNLSIRRGNFLLNFETKYRKWAGSLGKLHHPATLLLNFTATVTVWTGIFGAYYLILYSMNFHHASERLNSYGSLTVLNVILGSSGASLVNALPINFFGNFGTYEAGWVLFFHKIVGWGLSLSSFTGLWVHIVTFFAAGVFALIGWIALLVFGKPDTDILKR
jgi:hypothetical protein